MAGLYTLLPLLVMTFMSAHSLFIFPSLLVGLYQLRVKEGNRKVSLLMLILGIVMIVLVFLFFVSGTYIDE